jgi:lipopolysaccharide transport system ATP-binding protein
MTIAIKIENLSKQYRLGLVSTRTLSHDLNRWYQTNILGKEDPYLKIGESAQGTEHRAGNDLGNVSDSGVEQKSQIRIHKSQITYPFFRSVPRALSPEPKSEYIWALRDINLEVEQGEVLGIIGKNGAGKSTLLKILSKVTAPTTGTIKAKGRIASLLEVGTGFHPEMTGRENIFMNGAILGMTKTEIQKKFDEIVNFSGVETFIDTPVKRYSSGMLVRLGFAVASHLEPEILIVDEVLAVGDAEFQRKAVGKMQDISHDHGRTVLFVSHNMSAIMDLCIKGLLIIDGSIICNDIARNVVIKYNSMNDSMITERAWYGEKAPGNEQIKLRRAFIIDSNNRIINYAYINQEIGFCIEYEVLSDVPFFTHGVNVYNHMGLHLFTSHDDRKYNRNEKIRKGVYRAKCWIPKDLFQNDKIEFSFACMRYNPYEVLFHERGIVKISIMDRIDSATRCENFHDTLPGIIRPKINWDSVKKI